MANEIKINGATPGVVLYAIVENAAGNIWNTASSTFGAWSDGSIASYAVTMAEQGASGRYRGDFPSGIAAAGKYNVAVRQRAGASPALADAFLGSADLEWKGAAELSAAADTNAGVLAVKAKTDNLPASPAAVGSTMVVDNTTALSSSQTPGTVGYALLGMEAEAFGKETIASGTWTKYRADGTTVVKTFTVSPAPTDQSRS